jgi:hypothetical protein
MVQAAEHRGRGDVLDGRGLPRSRPRRVAVQGHVRTAGVVPGDVLGQQTLGMRCIQDNEVVRAVPTDRADDALPVGVHPGLPRSCALVFDAERLELLEEPGTPEGLLPIVDEVLRPGQLFGEGFRDLSRRPRHRGAVGHGHVADEPTVVLEPSQSVGVQAPCQAGRCRTGRMRVLSGPYRDSTAGFLGGSAMKCTLGMRPLWSVTTGLVLLTGALAPASAQGIGGEPEYDPENPYFVGQWAGPWDVEDLINEDDVQQWNEIAHAILLPDKTDEGRTRVLLICRRDPVPDSHPQIWPLPSAYVWDPENPTDLIEVPFDPHSANLENRSEDPFCGGHAFTPEGDVAFFGGTDMKMQDEENEIYGHQAVYVFVNDPDDDYYWVRVGTMSRERWYATVTALGDGSLLGTGHSHFPMLNPSAESTFDRGTITYSGSVPTGIAWQSLVSGESVAHENLAHLAGNCSTLISTVNIGDYPRQHLLLNGTVFWGGFELVGGVGEEINGYFDLAGCPSETIKHRWTRGPTTGDFPQEAERGNDCLTDLSGASPVQYVYGLGGAPHFFVGITNDVVRMVNPNPVNATWVDDDAVAPDLNFNTFDGNYPILLDGSILKVGGYGLEPAPDPEDPPTFPARKQPELFQPSGIFDTPLTGWKLMEEQLYERRYHSTAVTLPSGKVVSAGGDDTEEGGSTPEPSWYSLEVFSPPYLFKSPRPRLINVPLTAQLGTLINIDAVLRTTSSEGEFRVALLAPGAATHAFDQHQHYIKLEIPDPVTPNPNPNAITAIDVLAPDNFSVARGWYMLVVTNSVGVPSTAQWIKLTE